MLAKLLVLVSIPIIMVNGLIGPCDIYESEDGIECVAGKNSFKLILIIKFF